MDRRVGADRRDCVEQCESGDRRHDGERTPGVDRGTVLVGVLGAHLAVALLHGTTHGLVPVPLPPWQNALVALTTFVGPVAGVVLARRGHPLGLPLFTLSMAGALLLGGVLHFVLESPDHVAAVPAGPWRLPFRASAVAVALAPLVGTAVGAWYWRRGSGALTYGGHN